MDCENMGDITICGNFAELLPEKPKDFDWMSTAKWLEPYPFDWRETLGKAICNCKAIECHYAPYYGIDYYHRNSCNLMRKLKAEPQIENLREHYLPSITHYTDAVPNSDHIPLYIESQTRTSRIKIRRSLVDKRQVVLI